MEKKTIIIDVQTDEGVKSLNRLESSFEDVYGEIQPLTGRIGELEDQLYEMAVAGQQGTKEFSDLAAQIGKMKKVIIDVDMEVDGLSMSFSQKLGGAIGGVASGFELVQGAFGALGAESEKVQEALLKVQSAMAIAQGVQGLREAVPAFKAFGKSAISALQGIKGAIAATGIGLLVIAVGTLVAYWDDIKEAISGVSDEQERLNKASAAYVAAANENLEVFQKKEEILRLQGVSEKEILKLKMAQTDEAIKATEIQIKQAEQTLKSQIEAEKRNKAILKGIIQFITAPLQMILFTIDKVAEFVGEETNLQDSLNDWVSELVFDPKDVEEKGLAAIKEQKKALEGLKMDRQKYELQITNIEKEAEAKRKEVSKKKAEELKKQQDELNKTLIQSKNDELAKIEEIDELIYQSKLTAQQKEIIALNDYYFEKIELAKQYGLDYQALEEERNKKVLEVNKKYEDERAKKVAEIVQKVNEERKKQDDYDKQKAEEKRQRDEQYFELSKQTLNTFSELVDSFAGQDEASQRKAFKLKKAASIAQTTIETYQAAQSAYASQMAIPTPDAPIRAAVAAGIAIASGLSRVKSIASQQFSGGGSSSSAGGGGGVSLPSVGSSATFNVVGNSNTNQIVEGINANPVQAYVVAGEVTTAQNLDRNRIKTATL